MNEQIYLDHAATTPLDAAVLERMLPFLTTTFGNPSSAHATGRAARAAVDDGRDRLAAAFGCEQRELIITSGGSEADNLALRGILRRWGAERGRHLVVSAIDHEAVLATARQLAETGVCELTVVDCDEDCRIDPERVAAAVRDDTVLVSVMHVNNETGVIQEIGRIAEAVRARNPRTWIHCDAVQAAGKLEVSLEALGVDLISISAHKLYGPKGTGALLARWGCWLEPQITGGGQERGRRSGTENVAGIVGFAAAAELANTNRADELARQMALRDALEAAACDRLDDIVVAGRDVPRVGISALVVGGAPPGSLVTALDRRGIAVSGGSACSSGADQPSHVLACLGLDASSAALLRCSVGRATTMSHVTAAADAIVAAVEQARAVTAVR